MLIIVVYVQNRATQLLVGSIQVHTQFTSKWTAFCCDLEFFFSLSSMAGQLISDKMQGDKIKHHYCGTGSSLGEEICNANLSAIIRINYPFPEHWSSVEEILDLFIHIDRSSFLVASKKKCFEISVLDYSLGREPRVRACSAKAERHGRRRGH